MEPTARIEELIVPSLQHAGYCVIRVRLAGSSRRTLQVMVEPFDEGLMNVDDCAALSRIISAILEVEDPISGAYTLEVSSPGIDRPLVRLEDFERFSGFEAKLEMRQLKNGRRRYQGRLLGVVKDCVRITSACTDGKEAVFEFAFDEISSAKLVLTDDLIEASLRQGKADSK